MLKERYVFNSELSKEYLQYADSLDFNQEENITKVLRNRTDKYLEEIAKSVNRENELGFVKLTYEKDREFGIWIFYRNVPIRLEIVFGLERSDFKISAIDTLYNLITSVERWYGLSWEYNENAVYLKREQEKIDLLYQIAHLIKDEKIDRIKGKIIPRILHPSFNATKQYLFMPDVKLDDKECDLFIIKSEYVYNNFSVAYEHGLIYENLAHHIPEFIKDVIPDVDPEESMFTSLSHPVDTVDLCFIFKDTKKRHHVQLIDLIPDDVEHYLNYILKKL